MTDGPKEDIALLTIIAGPAGSGKSTLCQRLLDEFDSMERVVTCTTRGPREGERDERDYHFLGDAEFDRKIAENEFLEWARVHDHRYGTLKSVVQAKLEDQIDLVMNIDIQGVRNYQKAAGGNHLLRQRLVTIFVMPPDMEELRKRLRERGTDAEEEIERRMRTAEAEIRHWREFDYAFFSRSKDEDFEVARSILRAEKRRVSRMRDG